MSFSAREDKRVRVWHVGIRREQEEDDLGLRVARGRGTDRAGYRKSMELPRLVLFFLFLMAFLFVGLRWRCAVEEVVYSRAAGWLAG